MLAGSLLLVAVLLGQAECLFGARAAAAAAAPEVSTTWTALTGPITPAPTRPWTNSSRSIPSTLSQCVTCQDPVYSQASACSLSSRQWSSSYRSWHDEHYTVSQSILSTYATLTVPLYAPTQSRGTLQQCQIAQFYCIVTNQLNLTVVAPQYAAESEAAAKAGRLYDYPVRQPNCGISQYGCELLWDRYDQNSTGLTEPDCRLGPGNLCNPAYALSSMKSLIIPTYTWVVPGPTPTAGRMKPGAIPKNKWTPDTVSIQSEPQQQQQQPPLPPAPSPAQEAPARAPPTTTVVTLKSTAITATLYPASSGKATTLPPSVVISGKTLVPAAAPVTVGGATLSLAPPDGALVSVSATSTAPFHRAEPVAGSESTVTTEVVVLAGRTYTATASGSVVIFSPGLTATMGGPSITLPHNTAMTTGTSNPDQSSESQVTPSSQASSPSSAAVAADDQDTIISVASNGDILVVAQSTVVPAPTVTGNSESSSSSLPEPADSQDDAGVTSSALVFVSSPTPLSATIVSPANGPAGLAALTAGDAINDGSFATLAAESPATTSGASSGSQGGGDRQDEQGGATSLLVPNAVTLVVTTMLTACVVVGLFI